MARHTALTFGVDWGAVVTDVRAALGSDAVYLLGAFLLAYALKRYKDGDPELVKLLEGAKHEIAQLRWSYGLDLSDLEP